MKPDRSMLSGAMEYWGIPHEVEQIEQLMRYAEMVNGYSEANITGAKSIEEIVRDHLTDSLSCLMVPEVREARSSVDVGSGGGFPALPLAISTAPARWTMIEATQKKARFLRHAVSALGLSDASVLSGRAEEVGRDSAFRGRFNAATARAVASLDVLVEYCVPLLRTGGVFVAMKAGMDAEELRRGEKAAKITGAEISEIKSVPTPPGIEDRQRNLVVVRKVSETPEEYPRGVGTPGKVPLGA